jgi:L-iditol 2-dehydrogenase
MASIRVGVMTSPGKIGIREVPKPRPGPGQVLVKIEACGICTTEQRIYSGVHKWERFPYVGGHEAVGVVEAFGPHVATDVEIGDHVALFSATCGHCDYCRRGQTTRCQHRDAFWEHHGLWGTWGFADYRVVRPRGLQVIDRQVPFEQAALAEPLCCVVHGMRKTDVGLADEVVVIGAGTMGLLNALVYKAIGAVVTVLDLQESRCQKALDAGIDQAFVPDGATVERINAWTGGRGPELVVVASSAPQAYELGQALLGPFGRLLAFAGVYPHGEMTVDFSQLHRSETRLVGSVSSDIQDILLVGKLISRRLIDVACALEGTVPFDQLAEAMDRALRPDTYRLVLRM